MNYIDTNIKVTMWIRCQLQGGEDGQRTLDYSWTVNGSRWMCVACFVAPLHACMPSISASPTPLCHTGVLLFPFLPGVITAHKTEVDDKVQDLNEITERALSHRARINEIDEDVGTDMLDVDQDVEEECFMTGDAAKNGHGGGEDGY